MARRVGSQSLFFFRLYAYLEPRYFDTSTWNMSKRKNPDGDFCDSWTPTKAKKKHIIKNIKQNMRKPFQEFWCRKKVRKASTSLTELLLLVWLWHQLKSRVIEVGPTSQNIVKERNTRTICLAGRSSSDRKTRRSRTCFRLNRPKIVQLLKQMLGLRGWTF